MAWGTMCTSTYEGCLFHAASLLVFFGALRVSELVVSSKNVTSGLALVVGHVNLQANRMVIIIQASKMDQRGKGRSVELGACGDKKLGPVMAVS